MTKISPKKIQAVTLLAQGKTGREVAKELEVTPQTVSGWKQDPVFQMHLDNLHMEALEAARGNLQGAAETAVQTLAELAKTADSAETRRKAALDILRLAGFEPGQHETFAWGIGPTTHEALEKKLKEDQMLPLEKHAELMLQGFV